MKKITKTLFIAALFVIFAFQTKVSAATPTLQQIANSFNSSDTVKEFAKAKSYWTASADENTLTIKATANGSKDSATYTLNGTILSLTFTKDNSLFSAVSATILIDSIGHLHGYAYGDMFPTLNETEVISKYTLENEGLHMEKTSDGGGKIQIDISKKIPILDQSQIYIKPSDLISSTGQKFSSYSKGNLLFMKDTKDGNTVFIFAEEPKLTISTYKSILSVIEVYYGAKEAATFQQNYSSLSLGNKTFSKYKVERNPKISSTLKQFLDGSEYLTITIIDKISKPSLKTPGFKVKAMKKAMKVKVSKVSNQTGITIRFKKSGAKKWTTKRYNTSKSITKTYKKLKSKKKYLVQVRAFNKTTTGKWSKTKTIKIK